MNMNFNSNILSAAKARRQKFGFGSFVFLIVFGAIFTGVGMMLIQSNQIDPTWIRDSGRVVDVSSSISDGTTMYTAVVEYKADEQTRRITDSTSSSAYPNIGSNMEVAYNPARPDQAKVVQTGPILWLFYLLPLIGFTCVIIAITAYIRSHRRSGDIRSLTQTGQKIQGVVTEILNSNNNGYKIVVSATNLTGTVQTYTSDTLTGIGGLAMADFRNHPIPMDVYINPSNPTEYYVDVSDVPNLTPERIVALIQSAGGPPTTALAPQPIVPTPPVETNIPQPPKLP